MTGGLESLGIGDVERLVLIIESLDASDFDFLQLEVGDLKVTLGKGSQPEPAGAPRRSAPVAVAAAPVAVTPSPANPLEPAGGAGIDTRAAPAPTSALVVDPTLLEITAPMMGLYYAQPEPGALPFAAVGDKVTADTTVGLIEVMKTFSAVLAGIGGEVVEVCVENHQLVEYGQVLFRVRARPE